MKKFLALTFLTLATTIVLGCATQATSSSNGATGTASVQNATHYRLLSDPLSVRRIDWGQPPRDLHVKGVLTTRGFEPIGGVTGRGRLCTEGQDWVSLRDGTFHPAGSGKAPQSPYVRGCKGRTGGFMPASREVS